MFSLPESLKIVLGSNGLPIVAANALSTGDYICMKGVHKAWCVVVHSGANNTDLVVSFMEATSVAGGSAAAITATMPMWKDINAGSLSDTLVRQTDAANVTIEPDLHSTQLTVFEWDPAKFSAGFDCIAVKGATGHASNNVCVLWFLDARYPADQPPAVITD
jgi:hypothetical protein